MRLSTESVREVRQGGERRVDEQRTSDRFLQLLRSTDDKGRAQHSGVRPDESDAQAPTAVSNSTSANPSGPISLDASCLSSSFAPSPGEIAQAGATTTALMDKLLAEIGYQIDIFAQEGGGQALNITFDSRPLEGLQVQIRRIDGELSIQFVTHSDRVSNLLSRHSGELREALSGKAIRIGKIAIIDSRHPTGMRRNKNAGD